MLQSLFQHNAKVPSLLNPATHTFKMSEWADKATVGEGDMGTNVVWMYPQLWQPKDDKGRIMADGVGDNKFNKYNTHEGVPGH